MIFLSILILIVAIALPSISKMISPLLFTRISSIIFIYAGALSLNALYIQSIGSGIGIYSGLFQVTTVSQLIDTFIFIIASLILIAWPSVQKMNTQTQHSSLAANPASSNAEVGVPVEEGINGTEALINEQLNSCPQYSLLILFSTLGASLLISSADLISMYLSIELQSFGVYILSTLYRDSESATSAGLKYFLLGGLSSCLILLGAGIVYSYTGLTQFESIYNLISVSNNTDIIQGLSLGFIIIIVGFLFKIAAAPLHNWAPDVYDNSPTLVTIWLTIMPKISIIIFMLEIYTQISIVTDNFTLSSIILDQGLNNIMPLSAGLAAGGVGSVLKNLLLLSSLLSLIIGTIVGLAQTKIKRLLAYSTISHVGFILLALAINTEQSLDSLIFYIMQYTITNLNTFLILIALGYIIHANITVRNLYSSKNTVSEGDIKYISELKGQFIENPLLSLSLTVCLFSMAGIPPLLGFFSKQFVLYSAIQSGYYFMSILAIIVSIISASYYLKIIKVLHAESTIQSVQALPAGDHGKVTPAIAGEADISIISNNNISHFHSYLISTLTLSILFFILKPSILLNSTQLLSLSLFNY